MRKLLLSGIALILILTGCSQKVSQQPSCPPFPLPPDHVITALEDLHDPQVDNWVVALFKLKQQLDITNKK